MASSSLCSNRLTSIPKSKLGFSSSSSKTQLLSQSSFINLRKSSRRKQQLLHSSEVVCKAASVKPFTEGLNIAEDVFRHTFQHLLEYILNWVFSYWFCSFICFKFLFRKWSICSVSLITIVNRVCGGVFMG